MEATLGRELVHLTCPESVARLGLRRGVSVRVAPLRMVFLEGRLAMRTLLSL